MHAGYKYSLRVRNSYGFASASTVARWRLNVKLDILSFSRNGGEISSDNRIALMFSCMLRAQPTGVKDIEFAKNQNSVVLPSILTKYGQVVDGR